MDSATLKMFVNALFTYVEARTQSPLLLSIEKAANAALNELIDDFLKTEQGKGFLAPKE